MNRLVPILAAVLAMTARPAPQDSRPSRDDQVQRFVRSQMGFSDRDWRNLRNGRSVARLLDAEDGRDVAVFGAVQLRTSAERVLEHVRRIEALERALGVEAVGRIGDPASSQDLATLAFNDQDLHDAARCRPGDCELQLTAAGLSALSATDWQAPDAATHANHRYREMILRQLHAYRAGGLPALAPYVDRDEPTDLAAEARRITHAGDVPVPVPELMLALDAYPRGPTRAIDDFFYWNTGDFGMKPTTRVNHVLILRIEDGPRRARGVYAVVATRQVYANHYFSATLEWRTVVESDDPNRCYLLYTTRSRVPGLSGFIGTLIRPIVRSRTRSGMERYLGLTRDMVENGRALPGSGGGPGPSSAGGLPTAGVQGLLEVLGMNRP
ncbi:MAG: hypothetical protein R2752_01520 [Vicinamibacterales bacterium]